MYDESLKLTKTKDFNIKYCAWLIKHGFQSLRKALQAYTTWACLLCLRALIHVKSVCAHARMSMHVSPFKCYLLRGEKESVWAPVGRLGPGQRSPLPVRQTLLSSKSRDPQLWGLAHKPVYSDLSWAGGRHIDFLLFLARPTHSITSERAPCRAQFPLAWQTIRPEKFHLSFSCMKQEPSFSFTFWIKWAIALTFMRICCYMNGHIIRV